jgi:uncharacterized repeat protein (TIGR03803 family)
MRSRALLGVAAVLALFACANPCAASNLKILHAFTGGADGGFPYGGLIADTSGNLYGTTFSGGTGCNCGVVYKIAPDGTETVLHSFGGYDDDGGHPYAELIFDNEGNLYGTTIEGGADGAGTVFRLAPDGTETLLHSFGRGNDGDGPYAAVTIDKRGNLYGVTSYGGTSNQGTVFEINRRRVEKVLYSFSGNADGGAPAGRLALDDSGNLYGTAPKGGLGSGVVFKLAPNGTETVLYAFTGAEDGGNPALSSLIRDEQGNLYGTTLYGGVRDCPDQCGIVFKVAPDDTETVLHAFSGLPSDAAQPYRGVIADSAGNLFGSTFFGGRECRRSDVGCGAVFKLAADGTESILRPFGHGDGWFLASSLLEGRGKLFGTAVFGGPGKHGTVFELSEEP